MEATLINPLRAGMRHTRTIDPCIMVIFGATGDLTHRKLIPALYNLALEQPLPAGFSAIGFARREYTNEDFRKQALAAVNANSRRRPVNANVWETFAQGLFYCPANFDDPAGYDRLGALMDQLDRERGTAGNRIFYLATDPSYYPTIIALLREKGLARRGDRNDGWSRIIVEKPFGRNLASAQALNDDLSTAFHEGQIYRIDHYLGKETVQNILVMRFGNGIFEPIWNRRYIHHVQITAAESLGLEGRAGYYEKAGALRDMIQNHMMQLLTLVAMEPPAAFVADSVRDEKVKVLRSIVPLQDAEIERNVVRGQYGSGWQGGEHVLGYCAEPGVARDSRTETFVALKLLIENWRWAGVPFYLRTGKRLTKRLTEIAIEFKRPPYLLFKGTGADEMQPNVLSLRIQPNEGVSLRFGAKVPGQEMQIRPVNMEFFYGRSFGVQPPEAYERLLLDCMYGDSTLFTRRDETELSWRLVDTIAHAWSTMPASSIGEYEPGSSGPRAADELIERDEMTWRRL
ncbi:MAG TPA: glucose-6-phosphate dehydrogenase [Ktedonobacterales bacterium]|nr:glucose-6-phosphate dehydrogenase [Ktedonobacterales bacterium]